MQWFKYTDIRLTQRSNGIKEKNVKVNEEYKQNDAKFASHATVTHRECIFPL